jgi:hypothetical protein
MAPIRPPPLTLCLPLLAAITPCPALLLLPRLLLLLLPACTATPRRPLNPCRPPLLLLLPAAGTAPVLLLLLLRLLRQLPAAADLQALLLLLLARLLTRAPLLVLHGCWCSAGRHRGLRVSPRVAHNAAPVCGTHVCMTGTGTHTHMSAQHRQRAYT